MGANLFGAGVPAGLQPDRDHAIDAGRLGLLGMDRAGNDLQPFHPGIVHSAQMLSRPALRGDDDGCAFRDGDVQMLARALVVERDVHRVGGVSQAAQLAQRGLQRLRVHRPGRHHAQAASGRDSGCQFRVGGCPAHAGLNDGIADTQKAGQRGLQSHDGISVGKQPFSCNWLI
ncbi:hypothetical protein D3C73_917800 [compost metagenome]